MGKDIQGGILKWIMRISYYEKPCRFSYKIRLKYKLRFPHVLIWKILSEWKNQDAEQYIEDNTIIYTYIYISIYMFLFLDIHPSIQLSIFMFMKKISKRNGFRERERFLLYFESGMRFFVLFLCFIWFYFIRTMHYFDNLKCHYHT